MRDLRKYWLSRFWESDPGLSALLVVLLLTMFVAPAMVSTGILSRLLIGSFFSLLLISGVISVLKHRRARRAFSVLAVATFVAQWTNLVWPSRAAGIIEASLELLAFGLLAALVLIRVFQEGRITVHRITGSVVAYMLFGLIWSEAYRLVFLCDRTAFNGLGNVQEPWFVRLSLGYYSYVTLTTLGYGDITPVLPAARGLAMMEALVGQLFPAILIARLVSLELMGRDKP